MYRQYVMRGNDWCIVHWLVWGAVNPLPGTSGKGSTAPRHGGVVKVSKGHGESLESYFVERFSVRNFHCGTFSGIFTADPSLRKPHCGAPA